MATDSTHAIYYGKFSLIGLTFFFMRPPLLTEDSIRAAIRELAATGGRVTGVAVRSLLAARYGARGGVVRIYRLVHEAQRLSRDPAAPRPGGSRSDESREAALARADLAEERERVHQERWARETDALRSRLAKAEEGAREEVNELPW